ncbi:lipid droplet-associated hydrolase [Protopterus annectens]|uniref:lipid droplet-associated hydrolase n=1 Tax=Protopterus annectens TaxID=7888 RepID=UPI001CF9EE0F|nr:lipid droplet-associated hydrolase [Protopterus annectens]
MIFGVVYGQACSMGNPVLEDQPICEFISCGGAATEILKFGPKQIHGLDKSDNISRVLFLVIPGNPGIVNFYRTFMHKLYKALNQLYPVWAVSHAGHCVPPPSIEITKESEQEALEDVYGLNGQIAHKIVFIRKYVPKNVKLVLIGHSIGCYIILKMMKQEPSLRVLRAVLLFPTIERMAQSPQGKLMTPVLCRLRYVIYVPVYMLSFLPESVKTFIVRFVLQGMQNIDEASLSASVCLFNVNCLANAMYMASQEMVQVVDRDSSVIKEQLKKFIFYYGASDKWCPLQYYEDMKMEFPDGDIRLCEKGIRHAFVLDASKQMAAMIVDWLCKDLLNL